MIKIVQINTYTKEDLLLIEREVPSFRCQVKPQIRDNSSSSVLEVDNSFLLLEKLGNKSFPLQPSPNMPGLFIGMLKPHFEIMRNQCFPS